MCMINTTLNHSLVVSSVRIQKASTTKRGAVKYILRLNEKGDEKLKKKENLFEGYILVRSSYLHVDNK